MTLPSSTQTLPRVLGPWIAAAVVVGTVIGSGVFKKGQAISERIPESGLALCAWVLGGILTLLGSLALAEIAVLYPRAGGNYQFLKEGYGRLFGYLWGWVEFWIIRPASIAALSTIFVDGLHDLLRMIWPEEAEILAFWPRQGLTMLLIAAMAIVNAAGTTVGGRVQLVLTVIKVGSLIGIMALPVIVILLATPVSHPPSVERLRPFWPADWTAINWGKFGAALVGVLWAYDGWRNIGPIAEEVREPQRNIPRALLGGVFLLIALYTGANLAYYLVISPNEMAQLKDTTVATEFCLRLLGSTGAMIASLAVMTSVLGAANGNVLVGPRLLFAMARDRMAPASLARLDPRTRTPVIAIVALAIWSLLLVMFTAILTRYRLPPISLGGISLDLNLPEGKSGFDTATDFAMFGAVVFDTLAVSSIFVFRVRFPIKDYPRAYRCIGYPWVPILYVLIMAGVLVNMFWTPDQRFEAIVGLGFIAVGAAVYALFIRRP